MNTIKIDTEFITLTQMMKIANLVQSGGHAKQIIQQGFVSVNNEPCTQRGRKLYKDDQIEYEGTQYIIT